MGIPCVLSSDQGREFNNAMNKELAELMAHNSLLSTGELFCKFLNVRYTNQNMCIPVEYCRGGGGGGGWGAAKFAMLEC